VIQRDEVGINVTYLAVLGLNTGEIETVDQNGEPLAAGQIGNDIGSLARLAENLGAFRVAGTVDVPHVVSPCGGSRQKTYAQ
jgi:hypothetical protein